MDDLRKWRQELDTIDTQMLILFEQRMRAAREIAEYKQNNGLQIFDEAREQHVMSDRIGKVSPELSAYTKKFVATLMELSRELQHETIHDKRLSVAYSGVKGAYAHEAALQYFGKKAEPVGVENFEDVFLCVVNGKTDFGILPVENSFSGSVTQNLDLLGKYGCYIVGEYILPIEHCLMCLQEADFCDLREVYSHEQAFLQCNAFFEANRNLATHRCENTAAAAKFISDQMNPAFAAVASKHAAAEYGLKILESGINTAKNNFTRFIIVSKTPNTDLNCNKASIYFALKNKRGSLANVLNILAAEGLNLSKIESRPIVPFNFEYCFYVDVEGDADESFLRSVFKKMDDSCSQIRLLGRYVLEAK